MFWRDKFPSINDRKGCKSVNNFDLKAIPKTSHIHFIGIGGISMSGIAEILIKRGYRVSGSDTKASPHTERLSEMGATIYIGQKKENIKSPDLVVYSAAIKPDNEEYMAAVESGAVVIDRATILGAVMRDYKYPVAVSGTHGKTTTTSMLAHIFMAADLDPTISVGGDLEIINGNIRAGKSDYFVCEACEYHQSFLRFFPFVSIILNIEEDHLDYFTGLEHIIETFNGLARLTPDAGAVVVNADDNNVLKAVNGVDKNKIKCSVKGSADYQATNIEYEFGKGRFDVLERGEKIGRIKLSVGGAHNVSNALLAIAAARFLNVDMESIEKGLYLFGGAARRFDKKGTVDGIEVIDDYAHHPTEIKATLKTARAACDGDIWCVFQPHTYTRTIKLFDDFVEALSVDIKPIIIDIYAAREKDLGIIHSKQLAEAIDGAIYLENFDKCVEFLKINVKPGDMIITMGAGDVYKIGEEFLK